MERTPSGIKGLDDLIDGGLPRGTWTLIYGENHRDEIHLERAVQW
jgi:KaiC/GvpD/RAD55 family RecA-like ATPase